ncbi:MAG: ABC transporter substrate-binding protein [Acidimicrobiia bacterium]|nr:ABC transporter substrate-binding protein [Acidimicrobiia bacterium]
MGAGGRSAGQEVAGSLRAPARSQRCQRRTALRVWCGVVLLSGLGGCITPDTDGPLSRPVLTIGVPESFINGRDVGIGSLIRQSTLEGLTQVNIGTDGRAVPRLAERWTWEDEGRRLRLSLRPNVIFHDGTVFSSTVAADALRRAIGQPENQAVYPSLADIKAVRPNGELELVLDLSKASALLPEELDLPLTTENGMGTGPFRVVSRDTDGAVLERFDRYYLGTTDIHQILIRPFDTLRTAWSSLLRGDVDMVTDVPPEAVDFIRNDDVQVKLFARWYQFLIVFNGQRDPFRSAVVRRAMNFAVDREALIAKVLQGQGQPSTGPLWPRHWAYDASVLPFGFEPQFAVTLLDGAGLRPGTVPKGPDRPPARLRFTCLLPEGFSLLERIGLEVQKQLYDIGVDARFEVVAFQEWDRRIREGDFEAVLVDMISGPTLARPHLFWALPRREGLHAFGYENAEAGRLFELLRRSTNEGAIRSAVGRLQRVMLEDPPALFLAWNQRARAISSRFHVAEKPGHDPLLTIWQWTENSSRRTVATQ